MVVDWSRVGIGAHARSKDRRPKLVPILAITGMRGTIIRSDVPIHFVREAQPAKFNSLARIVGEPMQFLRLVIGQAWVATNCLRRAIAATGWRRCGISRAEGTAIVEVF